MNPDVKTLAGLILTLLLTLSYPWAVAKEMSFAAQLHYAYHRLLPLEGGSNFSDQVEKDYGTVENYLEKEFGVGSEDIAHLRSLYLN